MTNVRRSGVYLRNDRLPTRDAWQTAIEAEGTQLTLDEFDPRDFDGFLPCRLNGVECGFEYYFHALEEQDEELRDRIGDSNRVVTLVLHGELTGFMAAMRAAAALTDLSGGTFYDPQGDLTATRRGVYDLIREDEERERERGRLAAQKDAAITDARCPHCGAPCPSSRKTCKACGKSVGSGG